MFMVYSLWYSIHIFRCIHTQIAMLLIVFKTGVHSSASSVFVVYLFFLRNDWSSCANPKKDDHFFLCLLFFPSSFETAIKRLQFRWIWCLFVKIYASIYYGPLYVISHKFKHNSFRSRHTCKETHMSKVRGIWIIEQI